MVFKWWILFLFEVCLNLTTSSNLPEGCNLQVEIDYSGPPGIDPSVLCSSDCVETGKTFYYYEEILKQEYNSIIQVDFDEKGNVFCQIVPITEDILERENLTNSPSGSETSTTALEIESEDTVGISSPYPDYPSESSALDFSDTYDNDYQSPPSEVQNTPQVNESTADYEKDEHQSNASSKDDELVEEGNEPFYTSEEETEIVIIESSTQNTTRNVDLQDESQGSVDNINFNETYVNVINTFNTSDKVIDVGTKKYEENITFTEEFQNGHQETDKNIKTAQQEEILNSQQGVNQSTNQTSFPECSKGWILNPNSSTCYLVTQNVMNWYDANIACLQLGGVLSIFYTQEEVNFVKNNVELPESSWIGLEYTLSDNLTVKTWKWIDRSVADFTDWATGKPSSETSLWDSFWAYENCVEMRKSDGFAWNDERCTNMKRGLCSKRAELTPRTCPDDWLMQSNRCYYFSTEDLVEELADLQCSSLAVGVKLFAPQHQMEMDFVSDKLKERNFSSIWLGIKDTDENGDFRTPEGEPQTFFSWDCKEPSNSFWWFNTKECVQMSWECRMKRAKCSEELPFVCVLDL